MSQSKIHIVLVDALTSRGYSAEEAETLIKNIKKEEPKDNIFFRDGYCPIEKRVGCNYRHDEVTEATKNWETWMARYYKLRDAVYPHIKTINEMSDLLTKALNDF